MKDQDGLGLFIDFKQKTVATFPPAMIAKQICLQVNDSVITLMAKRILGKHRLDFRPPPI